MKVFTYIPPTFEPDSVLLKFSTFSAKVPQHLFIIHSEVYARNLENFTGEIELKDCPNENVFNAFAAAISEKEFTIEPEYEPDFLDLCTIWNCDDILKNYIKKKNEKEGVHQSKIPITPQKTQSNTSKTFNSSKSNQKEDTNKTSQIPKITQKSSSVQQTPIKQQKATNDSDESDGLIEVGPIKFPIFVSLPSSILVTIKVPLEETLGNFKKLVNEASAIPIEKQVLIFNGTTLKDDTKTLKSYNISPRSKIEVKEAKTYSSYSTTSTTSKYSYPTPSTPQSYSSYSSRNTNSNSSSNLTGLTWDDVTRSMTRTLEQARQQRIQQQNNQNIRLMQAYANILGHLRNVPTNQTNSTTSMLTRHAATVQNSFRIFVFIPDKKKTISLVIKSPQTKLSDLKRTLISLEKLPETYNFYIGRKQVTDPSATVDSLGIRADHTIEFRNN